MNQQPYYVYDLETFLRCFLFIGKFEGSDKIDVFEISQWANHRAELLSHLSYLQNLNAIMVGYNNVGFDYVIIHDLLMQPYTFDEKHAYNLGQEIINSGHYGRTSIRPSERIIAQVDLAKINGFDNKNKRTSLKSLQVAMRSQSVEDLPFAPDIELTWDMRNQLISYGCHDVTETEQFLRHSKPLIEMRQELLHSGVLGGDVLNFSDVKIGEQYLIKKLGRAKCYNGSNPKQTLRKVVNFSDIILPKIYYRTEPFQNVLDWFRCQQVWFTKGSKTPKFEANLGGLQFYFGVGGVHASVESKTYESNDTHVIKDIDVAGMYPSVAIANSFAPQHLGDEFKLAYRQVRDNRNSYAKGTSMNAMLKLAGNGVFGKSNDIFSCFYDPQFTYAITVNGQLQLLQLAEALSLIPGLEIIQANTDGVTVYMRRDLEHFFKMWCSEWESETGLVLEEVEYSHMWIRDVNNYLARTTQGKMKRKGAYWYPESWKDYEGNWNKDFSNMSAAKAIEQVLIHGWDPDDVVRIMSDPFDFMLRYKTPGGATVYIGDKPMNKTVRYYVSKSGEKMKKVAKPKGEIGQYKRKNKITDNYYANILSEIGLGVWDARIHTANKKKYEMTTTSIQAGRLVKECNDASKFNWKDVDYDYYAQEIRKLIVGRSNV